MKSIEVSDEVFAHLEKLEEYYGTAEMTQTIELMIYDLSTMSE